MHETLNIRFEFLKHKTGGLLVAISRDLDGLLVHGRSQQELRERAPGAIRALLEAQGKQVISIEEVEEDMPSSFESLSAARFNAEYAVAA